MKDSLFRAGFWKRGTHALAPSFSVPPRGISMEVVSRHRCIEVRSDLSAAPAI
eukprot:CAMPEP_0181169062 /NCGR_PEP_ID=MMETSP1096-20121128/611_2 /TAXON_ID=156174 ORGANISM="Chrysochromulina ericina, Strain CCMP281" /NCGR_SAMPLE_ID=MMETSP1096 /ASSEMBLY_ACC=CAM_ASM_000453 /LENGTH=52 /DNA_ID=CAMNT_0023256489 /DNA_START=187 /DNA_END=345 /DNA_ORIENTATION=-